MRNAGETIALQYVADQIKDLDMIVIPADARGCDPLKPSSTDNSAKSAAYAACMQTVAKFMIALNNGNTVGFSRSIKTVCGISSTDPFIVTSVLDCLTNLINSTVSSVVDPATNTAVTTVSLDQEAQKDVAKYVRLTVIVSSESSVEKSTHMIYFFGDQMMAGCQLIFGGTKFRLLNYFNVLIQCSIVGSSYAKLRPRTKTAKLVPTS